MENLFNTLGEALNPKKPKQIITVIDKAEHLLETEGKEKAIQYFKDRIAALSPPSNFGDVCKISGAKTAIIYLNKK